MSKLHQKEIDSLVKLLGGQANINSVSHCITRLRLVLNDPSLAKPKEIEKLPMVKGCFTNAGQFQVVIGPQVTEYYQALMETLDLSSSDKSSIRQAARKNMSFSEAAFSHIAEIFFPLLPALISGGLILGSEILLAIFLFRMVCPSLSSIPSGRLSMNYFGYPAKLFLCFYRSRYVGQQSLK